MALMGENGAGKSTLIKILTGAHLADDEGEVLHQGSAGKDTSPKQLRTWAWQ